MATVTMLFGEVGAGKTTYARTLERPGVVRLSLDEWTIAATGDAIRVSADGVDRVLDQLMRLWPDLVRADADVVLDFGFWSRPRRDQVRNLARTLGATVDLVHVRCPEAERRRRCLARTSSDNGSYVIDDGAFEWIAAHRQIDPLGPDEPHRVIGTA